MREKREGKEGGNCVRDSWELGFLYGVFNLQNFENLKGLEASERNFEFEVFSWEIRLRRVDQRSCYLFFRLMYEMRLEVGILESNCSSRIELLHEWNSREKLKKITATN